MDRKRRRLVLGIGLATLGGMSAAWAFWPAGVPRIGAREAGSKGPLPLKDLAANEILVVKSPYCGCCTKWAEYLAAAGWKTRLRDETDLVGVRAGAGVPESMAGCHTAFVDGYVVEGHLPAPAIRALVEQKPDLDGIAVPGMPADAPGMGGGGVQAVYGFRAGKNAGLFMRAQG